MLPTDFISHASVPSGYHGFFSLEGKLIWFESKIRDSCHNSFGPFSKCMVYDRFFDLLVRTVKEGRLAYTEQDNVFLAFIRVPLLDTSGNNDTIAIFKALLFTI